MPLVEFIREVWPQAYWSAGFIACLVVVIVALRGAVADHPLAGVGASPAWPR